MLTTRLCLDSDTYNLSWVVVLSTEGTTGRPPTPRETLTRPYYTLTPVEKSNLHGELTTR